MLFVGAWQESKSQRTGCPAQVNMSTHPRCIPEHIAPPARYGGEDPRSYVSGGVDGVATVTAQGDPNEQHQQAHCDGLAAHGGRFVLLVGQSHQAEQQHGCAKHLAHRRHRHHAETQEGSVASGAKEVLVCLQMRSGDCVSWLPGQEILPAGKGRVQGR